MITDLRFSDRGESHVIWTLPGRGNPHTAFIEPASAMFELAPVGLVDDPQYWGASISHETIHAIIGAGFGMKRASIRLDGVLVRALSKIRQRFPVDHARGFYFSDEDGMFAQVLEEVCLSK